MPVPSVITVPVGRGDIRFVYLDENYQPTTNDIGKMAMFIDNNKLAEGVVVIAELPGNYIDNEMVVRVINRQNNSVVSFFYFADQLFPHRMVLTIDGEEAIGNFSVYNPLTETYSITFSNEEGETEVFDNLVLNKNVFSLHENNDELSETQNVRLRNIVTTLALWNSLAFQVDDDFEVDPRNLRRNLRRLVVGTLTVVAVVAVAAAVIISAPVSVAVAGLTLTISLATQTSAILAAVAVVATAGAIFANFAIPDSEGSHGAPPPAPDRRPRIEITLDGERIGNNSALHYIDRGESLTFNISIIDRGEFEYEQIIDIDNLFLAFCPRLNQYIVNSFPNASFFDFNIEGDIHDVVQFTITRNALPGYMGDGRVQYVIWFRQNVIINDVSTGIYFIPIIPYERPAPPPPQWLRHIFVLNFTVIDPQG
ncbi:MAG: hypothetical protein FWC97_08700 [Treponema sp.]|nr:hypothetical protein [Treponema sp.]